MPRKRESTKPKLVSVGNTPLFQLQPWISGRWIRRREELRRRYQEVHGKIVDFIIPAIEDGTLFFSVALKDQEELLAALRLRDVHCRRCFRRHEDRRLEDRSREYEAHS